MIVFDMSKYYLIGLNIFPFRFILIFINVFSKAVQVAFVIKLDVFVKSLKKD